MSQATEAKRPKQTKTHPQTHTKVKGAGSILIISTMPANYCIKDCCRDKEPVKSQPRVITEKSHPYRMVFFGAPREYGPEEGWQTVIYKKGRLWHGKKA